MQTVLDLTPSPGPVVAAEARAVASLVASGRARSALKSGDRVPLFVLTGSDGAARSAREALSKGPLVVAFLLGAWNPHACFAASALESVRAEIEARSGSLLAISPQSVARARSMKRRCGTNYPLLSDAGGAIAAQFGLRWNVPPDLKEAYGRIGIDLGQINCDECWSLPMPALYVAGMDGIVAYAQIDPDFRRPIDPFVVLDTLDRIREVAPGESENGWLQEAGGPTYRATSYQRRLT
jgi:peroxiredoxin